MKIVTNDGEETDQRADRGPTKNYQDLINDDDIRAPVVVHPPVCLSIAGSLGIWSSRTPRNDDHEE